MEPSNTTLIAGISALLGAGLPIVTKFVLDFFTTKKKAEMDDMAQQFLLLRQERADLTSRHQKLIDDLQKQIFDLRTQLIEQQQQRAIYVNENAELRARITVLTAENAELKGRVEELEREVKQLRGV
jgi:hypothetical protein